jgi:hypothetical protein
MSEQSQLNNKYDNSDQLNVVEKADKFLGTATGHFDEVIETTKYINYLKAIAEIETGEDKKIKVGGKEMSIKTLLPARSQFEEERLKIIGLVNSLGVDDPLVKGMMRDFGTESVFELSSAYANYSLGRDRADKIYGILNAKTKDDKLIYDGLLDESTREDTKKAFQKGDFTYGFAAGRKK